VLLVRAFLPNLSRDLALLGAVLLPLALWPLTATAQLMPARGFSEGHLCRTAISEANRSANLPRALLQAIGRVESGRHNPDTGHLAPWPWPINAEGGGLIFPNAKGSHCPCAAMAGARCAHH